MLAQLNCTDTQNCAVIVEILRYAYSVKNGSIFHYTFIRQTSDI